MDFNCTKLKILRESGAPFFLLNPGKKEAEKTVRLARNLGNRTPSSTLCGSSLCLHGLALYLAFCSDR